MKCKIVNQSQSRYGLEAHGKVFLQSFPLFFLKLVPGEDNEFLPQ
jgi:hypothetical protein